MRRLLKWLGYGAAAVAGLLLIGSGWIWYVSASEIGRHHEAAPESLGEPTAGEMADAPRQALILGCVSCHGEGLRGRLMVSEEGVAEIWAPNLTEIAARASDQQLAAGIRQGIGIDGRALWVMPSPMYQRLGDGETAALIRHIRSLPRGGEASPPISVGPLGRFGIATGALRPATAKMEEFRRLSPYALGPEHEAGRRLVSLACTECHGPDLSGASPAPDISAPDLVLAGAYDPDQFRTLMRTGVPPGGRDLGIMREVSVKDFAHYTDEEIDRIHSYLRARAERLAD